MKNFWLRAQTAGSLLRCVLTCCFKVRKADLNAELEARQRVQFCSLMMTRNMPYEEACNCNTKLVLDGIVPMQ